MKTTIAFITFTLIAQSPARDYERPDYYRDTHRQDVDRIIEAQETTTKAVEKARAQASSDAQRARTEASLDAYDAQKAARTYWTPAPDDRPAASSGYTYTPAPAATFSVTPAGYYTVERTLDEDMIVMAAGIIRQIHAATNLTAAQKQREVQRVVATLRKAAALKP